MKIYRSPIYPALMVRLPGGDRRGIKASGGYFNVPDEDVEAFEKFVNARPQYRITESEGRVADAPTAEGPADPYATTTAAGDPQGAQTKPEPISESERHPETVTVESIDTLNVQTLRDRLDAMGLPTDGNKAVLVERLASATDTATGLGDEAGDSGSA